MRRVLVPHLHLLHCHLLSALLLSTSPFHLYLYPLFSIIDWLSLACPFSLSARCMLAPQLHLLHYCLLPALPLIKRCIFSLTLTAWLSLAYPFSLSSAVSKCLPSLCSDVQWMLDRILLLTPHTNYKQLHSISNMISRSLIDQLIYTQYVLCSAS